MTVPATKDVPFPVASTETATEVDPSAPLKFYEHLKPRYRERRVRVEVYDAHGDSAVCSNRDGGRGVEGCRGVNIPTGLGRRGTLNIAPCRRALDTESRASRKEGKISRGHL